MLAESKFKNFFATCIQHILDYFSMYLLVKFKGRYYKRKLCSPQHVSMTVLRMPSFKRRIFSFTIRCRFTLPIACSIWMRMDEITRLAAFSSGVSSPSGGFSSVEQSCLHRTYSPGPPILMEITATEGYSLPDQPSFYHSLSLHRWHSRSKYDGSHRSRGVCQPSWVKDNGHTHCSSEA
jgi:hypothetical protein